MKFSISLFEKPTEPVNPWAGSGGTYLARYKRHLNVLARKLTNKVWQEVYTEYDAVGKCALIRTKTEVLALLQIHGEVGSAYKAVVRTDLLPEFQSLFSEELLGMTIQFQPLRPYAAK